MKGCDTDLQRKLEWMYGSITGTWNLDFLPAFDPPGEPEFRIHPHPIFLSW